METELVKQALNYEAPAIEIIEVEVERGFSESTQGTLEDMRWS